MRKALLANLDVSTSASRDDRHEGGDSLKQVGPHHLEAARLALGRAALDAGKLAVLAAIDERATFRADRVVVKLDSDTRRLEHELAMMAARPGLACRCPR